MLTVCASDFILYLWLTRMQPEESISIQHTIGADIIMQLDDVG